LERKVTIDSRDSTRHSGAPAVLVIGGHDPSGAGLQADIETCFALGCHALPVVTAVTVQNTRQVASINPVAPATVAAQLRHLLTDVTHVHACKIGLLPNSAVAAAVASELRAVGNSPPLVLDPVLVSGSGYALNEAETVTALVELLPLCEVVKPNLEEARRLAGIEDPEAAAACLASASRRYVLLTGADARAPGPVVHRLYRAGQLFAEYRWPRLAGSFHGTGCTLASAVAAFLARRYSTSGAVAAALSYTWGTLDPGLRLGSHQALPDRATGAWRFRRAG
jgi:hydroxymethylpyrimidine/phosphomethylpyrimidine kinase